jgi:hypothetical protein
MKYINLFLVLSVIVCYGFSGGINNPCTFPNIANCHTNQQDEISKAETGNSYKNPDATNHQMSMCHYALLNAPHSYDFNPGDILCSVAVNIPTLEINKVSSFPLSVATKRECYPPDLFLTNSSFLL